MSPPTGREIGVGVIGLGFMGPTHIRAVLAARRAGIPCRLAAVADRSPERLRGDLSAGAKGNLDTNAAPGPGDDALSAVARHESAEALIADPGVHAVSVCTHTDSHVDLALAALAAGKHVLVEKPVAIRSSDVSRLADAAARSPELSCTPALCMRFWPGWTWLKDRIADGSLGAVRSAVFRRLGARPGWAPEFYGDLERSGGALVDLHTHDADFILWALGRPGAVTATGSLDHVTTIYHYPSGPAHVVAEAGWDLDPAHGFRMLFTVVFDEATAEFDLARRPPLVLHRGGESEPVPIPGSSAYDAEVAHFLSTIADPARERTPTMLDALRAAELLETERQSLQEQRTVAL